LEMSESPDSFKKLVGASALPSMRLSGLKHHAETQQALRQVERVMLESNRREAERRAAPVVTRDLTFRLNERVEELTGAVIALTKITEHSSRRLVVLTGALVFLTLVIVALTIVLIVG
jgi:hypothetical protein